MRVLLLMPNIPRDYRFGPKMDILLPPLGLEHIAAQIEDIAETRIIDNRIFDNKSVERELKQFQPDYVGISFNFTNQIDNVRDLAQLAKAYGAKTVLGGWHPTLLTEETLKFPWADFIVRSEGDLTFRELLQTHGMNGTKGLSYKNNGRIIHNPEREL